MVGNISPNVMKYHGSIMEFTRERDLDLLRAYRREVAKARRVSLREIVGRVVDSPSKRFWVSEMRAFVVCSEIARGRPVLEAMRPTKREMYGEIYRRFERLRKERPSATAMDLLAEVIYSPAPKFYMAANTAIDRITKMRNGHGQDEC